MNTAVKTSFALKGNMLPITHLQLKTKDIAVLATQLKNTVDQTPQFFNKMPVVIDFKEISDSEIDFAPLLNCLKSNGLIPVGVTNVTPQQEAAANAAGLGLMASITKTSEQPKKTSSQNKVLKPKIVSTPVRSGQQMYAQGTDLIVLAPVSPGAEVIADGHIHIYAPLRGRALAGVKGDTEAYIFCQSFQAELISIAGNYKLQDNFEHSKDTPVKIYLKENSLIIEELTPTV